jgi:hypothetical protein
MLYFTIGNTDNAIPGLFQPSSSFGVALGLIVMDWAINFKDQALLSAVKIHDKGADRMLPPPFEPTISTPTQMLP